jgi:phosphate starvation-inducible membrane PsiE
MERIKKYFRVITNNKNKFREFWIDALAGLLSGTTIGIFFSLVTEIKFIRWINLFSPEIFAAIIYVVGSFLVLFGFYWLGKVVVYFIDKKRLMSFRLNMIAGAYTSVVSFLLVTYHSSFETDISIAIIALVILFFLSHSAIKRRKPRTH